MEASEYALLSVFTGMLLAFETACSSSAELGASASPSADAESGSEAASVSPNTNGANIGASSGTTPYPSVPPGGAGSGTAAVPCTGPCCTPPAVGSSRPTAAGGTPTGGRHNFPGGLV